MATVKKKKKKSNGVKLNPRHKFFALEYMRNGRNATKAYLKTFPNSTYGAAAVSAHDLLKKPNISEFIKNYYDALWKKKEDEVGKTFENLLRLANADISNVVEYEDDEMKIKNFSEIDTSIVQSVNHTEHPTKYGTAINKSVKLFDKTKALSDLLKVLNMIQEKMAVTVNYDKESAERIQEIFGEPFEKNKK
jgi:phage terminase small subunit